jgi:hypothetical protein
MDILIKSDKTLTTQFLMPLLFKDKKYTEIIPDFKEFVNAFIADFDKPNNDNKIILVFKAKQKELPETNQTDHYTKEIKDKTLHFYAYDIPREWEEDYTSWLTGKYSQFNESAKQQILYFWEASNRTHLYGVLYRTGKAIKKFFKDNFNKEFDEKYTDPNQEWWFEPTLNKEIYGAE